MNSVNFDDCFQRAHADAARGNLVVVSEKGHRLLLSVPGTGAVDPQMVAAIEQMMPSTIQRKVAVIADTTWAARGESSLEVASRAIPFLGLLMGFASIGHLVWLFDGSASLFRAGCRGADVLIVDSALIGTLPRNWQVEAARVMRNRQILVHDRANYKLSPAT